MHDAGDDAQQRRGDRRRIDDEQQRVGAARRRRRGREQPPRIDAIGEAEERAGQAADDEARPARRWSARPARNSDRWNSAASAGMTAEAENHSAIAATWQTAMIAIDGAFEARRLAPSGLLPTQPFRAAASGRPRIGRTAPLRRTSDLRQRDALSGPGTCRRGPCTRSRRPRRTRRRSPARRLRWRRSSPAAASCSRIRA